MRDVAGFIALCVVGTVVLLAALFWVILLINFPGDRAQIEQLRRDAANVDPAQAEDVIGQVTAWNQTMASYQAYNDMPVIGILIPDGWAGIEPIPVPAP